MIVHITVYFPNFEYMILTKIYIDNKINWISNYFTLILLEHFVPIIIPNLINNKIVFIRYYNKLNYINKVYINKL